MALRTKTLRYCLGNMDGASHDVGKAWTVTSAGVWTNDTADINSTAASDVPLQTAVDSALYLGHARRFCAATFDVATSAAGGAAVWEYWNGSAWTALSLTGGAPPTDNGNIRFDPPSDWATTQVNGEVDGPWYYIRLRVTSTRTTAGTINAVALAPLVDLALGRTIDIPETSSRTIRHASIRVFVADTTNETIDHMRLRGRWDAASEGDLMTPWVTTNTLTGAGEAWSAVFQFDVTSITTTAWASGTSHTFDAWFACHGRGTAPQARRCNAWAELWVTYEYDDAATTQANTIVIPIESITGALTTSLATVGGASGIPQLDALMGESGVVIRDLYFIVSANANEAGTNDWDLRAALDAEGEATIGVFDAAQTSDFYFEAPWRRTDMALNAAHDFKLRVTSATGATCDHVGALLVVTYEYNHASSSALTHTAVLPFEVLTGGMMTVAGTEQKVTADVWVAGEAPTMVQSGIQFMAFQAADPGNLHIAMGSQTARIYSVPPTENSGPISIVQRIDAGGAAGAGVTFARGKVSVTVTARIDGGSTSFCGVNATLYLTYRYTKSASNRQSCAFFPALMDPGVLSGSTRWLNQTFQVQIPEATHFVGCTGLFLYEFSTNKATLPRMSMMRGNGLGWAELPGGNIIADTFLGLRCVANRMCDYIVQYAGQPDPKGFRVDIESAVRNIVIVGGTSRPSGGVWANWHDYTWAVAGNVSGSSGGTVNLSLHDATTGDLLKTASRVGDGAYSITWHDNTRQVYVVAREDGTHLGRSDNGLAA